jgi:hypothetical protein
MVSGSRARLPFPDAWLLLVYFVMSLCWVDPGTSLIRSPLFLPPGVFLLFSSGHSFQPSFLSPSVPFAFVSVGPLTVTLLLRLI